MSIYKPSTNHTTKSNNKPIYNKQDRKEVATDILTDVELLTMGTTNRLKRKSRKERKVLKE